jgi:hypothetical protein
MLGRKQSKGEAKTGDKKGTTEGIKLVRLAVPVSRSVAISQLNRAAERLFQHGLELDVSERTLLLQMCTKAFEFVVAAAFAQSGPIGVRTYFWIDVLGEEGRVRGHLWVFNHSQVGVHA